MARGTRPLLSSIVVATLVLSCAGSCAILRYADDGRVAVLLAAPFLVLLCLAFVDVNRRHDRRAKGLCVNCGYDLRATTSRCPECGAAVPSREPRA